MLITDTRFLNNLVLVRISFTTETFHFESLWNGMKIFCNFRGQKRSSVCIHQPGKYIARHISLVEIPI